VAVKLNGDWSQVPDLGLILRLLESSVPRSVKRKTQNAKRKT
jgi:hypothetical protein